MLQRDGVLGQYGDRRFYLPRWIHLGVSCSLERSGALPGYSPSAPSNYHITSGRLLKQDCKHRTTF